MDNLFIEFYRRFKHLQLADLRDLYKVSSLRSYKAGDIIARPGEHYGYVFGIRKGIIRTYVLTSGGEERTVRLAKEGDFVSCADSLISGGPSREFLEVVEDTKGILMDARAVQDLTKNNIRLSRLWNDALSAAFLDTVHRIQFFVTLTPEDRYKYLLEESPDLIRRVPQKYLASYIGVTTVSLSRIRSRVLGK